MAELFGVASGIAGLLSLTIELLKITKTYADSAGGARHEIQSLVKELQSLRSVLLQIDELGSDDTEATMAASMTECASILVDLRDKLGKRLQGSRSKVVLKQMVWPLSEKKTLETVQRLHRYLSIFQTSIGVDTNKGVRQALQFIEDLSISKEAELFKETLRWLSSLSMPAKQDDNLVLASPGSGTWFMEHETFLDWMNGDDGSVLWCPGDPGSGKTILSAIIVDYLARVKVTDDVILIYLFCDYKDSDVQTAAELLANLSKQLCTDRKEPPPELTQLASSLQNEGRRPNVQQAKRLFLALCGYYERVMIVVDAVDELQKQHRTALLDTLLDTDADRTKLLVTSRPSFEDIQHKLEGQPKLPVKAVEQDIRNYIEHKMAANESFTRRIGSTKDNGNFKVEIINSVISASSETFLLAALKWNQLSSCRTIAKIRKALESTGTTLPERLEATYKDAIARIKSQEGEDGTLGMRILKWLTLAKRPFLIAELCHALALEWDGKDLPTELDEDNVLDTTSLLEITAGLASISEESGTIRLAHFTTQEYLNSHKYELFPDGECEISSHCLAYMNLDKLSAGAVSSDDEFIDRRTNFPFFLYCCEHWGFHLRGQCEELHKDLALPIMSNAPLLNSVSQMRESIGSHPGFSQTYTRDLTSVHMAAIFGLDYLLESILTTDAALAEAQDSLGRTGLHHASVAGHAPIVNRLIQAGSNINTRDTLALAPLNLAIQHGHYDTVKVLLDHEASMEPIQGATPLHSAVAHGHIKLIELLLDSGHDLDKITLFGSTSLHFAADQGQEGSMKILLQRGADPNVADRIGVTPLHLATAKGYPSVVRILLENGAKLPTSCAKGEDMPLHLAITNRDPESIEILLGYGAMFDVKLESGDIVKRSSTLRQTQQLRGSVDMRPNPESRPSSSSELRDKTLQHKMIRMIMAALASSDGKTNEAGHSELKEELRVRAEEQQGSAPGIVNGVDEQVEEALKVGLLHLNAAKGDASAVQSLLQAGKNPNHDLQRGAGFTPLAFAVISNHVEVIRMLIGTEIVDVNAKFGAQNLLHITAFNNSLEAAELLLQDGAQCFCMNHWNDLPLHRAAIAGHHEMVKLLLKHDPDRNTNVNYKNKIGHTALWLSARFGHTDCVKVLLDAGGDPNIESINGSTARKGAESGRHKDIIALLSR